MEIELTSEPSLMAQEHLSADTGTSQGVAAKRQVLTLAKAACFTSLFQIAHIHSVEML